jgi:hypothetical protein
MINISPKVNDAIEKNAAAYGSNGVAPSSVEVASAALRP